MEKASQNIQAFDAPKSILSQQEQEWLKMI
jgi:hypothetical protein